MSRQSTLAPPSYPITGFRLSLPASSPLVDALTAAGALLDEQGVEDLGDKLVAAVRTYLDQRTSAASHSDVTKQIKSLQAEVGKAEPLTAKLLMLHDTPLLAPLAEKAKSMLQKGDPIFPRVPLRTFMELTDFRGLGQDLRRLTEIVEALSKGQRIGKRGGKTDLPQYDFVKSLAQIFEEVTGRRLL